LLPLNLRKSRHWSKKTKQKWDPTQPMVSWVKSWRKLMAACQMKGFRFHDLRHTFRTHGAEAGVPLEVMMAQLGHMDRETSLDYVHIQQRALQRAKELIEREQAEVLAVARGRVENSVRRIVTPPVPPNAGLRSSIHSIARSRRLSITRRGAYKGRR
jgi:Phage integrase family